MGEIQPSRRPSHEFSSLPHGLWSLWDMWDRLFGPLFFSLELLDTHRKIIGRTAQKGLPLDRKAVDEKIIPALKGLRKNCAEVGLKQSCKYIDRIIKKLKNQLDATPIEIQLDDLREAILGEGEDEVVFHVDREKAKLLVEDGEEGWEPAFSKFPGAQDDMYSAIACYGFDENNAAVFHCMRVLEAGLKSLAEALNVPFGTEVWHVVIDQIESEIRELERTWPRGANKSEFIRFYSTAAKEFRYFKDGWRNYVAHKLTDYDAPQALSTINHVRDFMKELSSRLSET